MKLVCTLLMLAGAAFAAAGDWFAATEPLMSPAEKKLYRSLSAEERRGFEATFWTGKLISREEYARRVAYVDQQFGSGKAGSGANTDRGRVYLSLGTPNRLVRLASSRTFFPMELWNYAEAPALGIHYQLQLVFYQPRAAGEYKLYSPNLNSIRDLMNPQASTRGMFGVNDIVTEGDIRTRLTLSPAEEEIADAAMRVARGITGMGNDEILALVSTPSRALSRQVSTEVSARLLTDRPELATFQTKFAEGVAQVDLALEGALRHQIAMEVVESGSSLARYETTVHFTEEKRVRYEHRLLLLPGRYAILFTIDGRTYPYPLLVNPEQPVSGMLVGFTTPEQRAHTPFAFGGQRLESSDSGNVAVLQLAQLGRITWRLREGMTAVWTARTDGAGIVVQPIGDSSVPPGSYQLEASVNGETRARTVRIGGERPALPVISYNANLMPSEQYRFVGHQWLGRGNIAQASEWLARAWSAGPSDAIRIEQSRIMALRGEYDQARSNLNDVLQRAPNNFEAICVLAYVEVKLQDYAASERLYARALEIQNSPAIAKALENVREQRGSLRQ